MRPTLRSAVSAGRRSTPIMPITSTSPYSTTRCAALPGDGPTKHLGEAETIVIIRRRAEFRGSVFLTDDRGAQDYALSEHAVSHCLGTADLLAYFEVAGWMSRAEAHACLETLRREKRHVRHADPAAYNGLVEGLLRRFKQKGRRR